MRQLVSEHVGFGPAIPQVALCRDRRPPPVPVSRAVRGNVIAARSPRFHTRSLRHSQGILARLRSAALALPAVTSRCGIRH